MRDDIPNRTIADLRRDGLTGLTITCTNPLCVWSTREAFDAGKILIYGPVMASTGGFGVAVLEMEDAAEVQKFAAEDPSIKAGMNTFEFCPMRIGAARGLA